ncbi:MAG: hydantoinase/oxoprolinase family protein [Elsteraceae bacterium]
MSAALQIAVDIGGTFTDLVLEEGERRLTRKVLTTPTEPEKGVMDGLALLLAEADRKLSDVAVFVHGTTLATNAILERKGAKTALIATEGFRDVLEIAYESRYDQYDISIEKPVSLTPRHLRLTVPERMDAQGNVRAPLDEAAVRALIPTLKDLEVSAVAVCFLHAYANSAHELRVRALLSEAMPELSISLSCEVCPEIREYERTSTTVANAYVQPLMGRYLRRLEAMLKDGGYQGPVYLMTSGGGLTTIDVAARLPIRLVESGPAGGAILAAHIAGLTGEDKLLSFDMGGTTAKICLIERGQPQMSRSFEVDRAARFLKGSGLPLRIPVIEMVEIGAGGGSIARIDALGSIAVGPDSAGSEPGPACYGRGGEQPTVTDADLTLGRIDASRFAAGSLGLRQDLALDALSRKIGDALAVSPEIAALGVSEMIDETMSNAARVHAVERGKAISDHSMVAFGGAAPLHAARLAEKLAIARVIIPPNAGVGSAVGFLRAPVAYEVTRSRYMRLDKFDATPAEALLADMVAEAEAVVRAGAGGRPVLVRRAAFMRYVGQGHELLIALADGPVTAESAAALREGFEAEYAQQFARFIPGAAIEILSWSVVATTPKLTAEPPPKPAPRVIAPSQKKRAVMDASTGKPIDMPVYWRFDLQPGDRLSGPAVIAEDETTTIVTARFDAHIDAVGCIVLERKG